MQTYYIIPLETFYREHRNGLLKETHWFKLNEQVSGKDMIFITCEFSGKDQIQREEKFAALPEVIPIIREIDDVLTNDALPQTKLDLMKKVVKVKDGEHARAVVRRAAKMNPMMTFKRF